MKKICEKGKVAFENSGERSSTLDVRKKKKVLPFQNLQYQKYDDLPAKDWTEHRKPTVKVSKENSRASFAFATTGCEGFKNKDSPKLNGRPDLRKSKKSFKEIDLYMVKSTLPAGNTFARRQRSMITRLPDTVDRINYGVSDLFPAVGPEGESYKAPSPRNESPIRMQANQSLGAAGWT